MAASRTYSKAFGSSSGRNSEAFFAGAEDEEGDCFDDVPADGEAALEDAGVAFAEPGGGNEEAEEGSSLTLKATLPFLGAFSMISVTSTSSSSLRQISFSRATSSASKWSSSLVYFKVSGSPGSLSTIDSVVQNACV